MRILLAGLLTLALAGCASAAPTASGDTSTPRILYAALGDSYTAAPYVVSTDVADGCLRSSSNYPRLVVTRLHAQLTDVSCSGASSGDVVGRQRITETFAVPPQIRAVTRDTDLVTIGLGGNDHRLFGQLVAHCPINDRPGGGAADAPRPGARCGHLAGALAARLPRLIRKDLATMLRAVKKRAPDARIVLIGYPRLAGERPCAALPIAPADLPGATRVAVRLRDAQRAAARAAGVDFLDLHRLSRGHDACAAHPWVRGVEGTTRDGAAMHPTAAGERAMAAALADHLMEVGFPEEQG